MSATIQFEWDNPNALLAQVRSLLEDRAGHIRKVPNRAIQRGAFELLRLVQQKAPKVTGTLVRSLHVDIRQLTADLIEGRVGTWLAYARYLEEGTGIHGPRKQPILITAKAQRALFWGAYDEHGKPFIRRSVMVQGIKPRGYFAEAIGEFLPRYVQIIEEEIAREGKAA